MYGVIKAIMMALALSGSPAENTATNVDNPYVGTWEWEKTITSGRGGQHTADATTTELTRQIIITTENKVQILENGKITCEGDFTINEKGDATGMNYNVAEGCMKGNVHIVDGKLKHYVYLGCPSSTSFYTKK